MLVEICINYLKIILIGLVYETIAKPNSELSKLYFNYELKRK